MPRLLAAASVTVVAVALPVAAPGTAAAAPLRPKDVAHRGASAHAPENTIPAFKRAKTEHADLFELDVQQTKDHRLIVMHDTTLARTTNVESVYPKARPWRVRDLTLKQIKRLDAGAWFGKKYKHTRVPTLAESLDAMKGSGLGLLLEIKNPSLYPGMTGRIASELRAHPAWLLPGRLIVQSFDWSSLKTFHKQLPTVPLGVLGKPAVSKLSSVATYARYVMPEHTGLTKAYVRSVHLRGLRLYTWTVNAKATMRRVIGYGVDGVITNYPGTLRSVIGSGPLT